MREAHPEIPELRDDRYRDGPLISGVIDGSIDDEALRLALFLDPYPVQESEAVRREHDLGKLDHRNALARRASGRGTGAKGRKLGSRLEGTTARASSLHAAIDALSPTLQVASLARGGAKELIDCHCARFPEISRSTAYADLARVRKEREAASREGPATDRPLDDSSF